MDNGADIVVVGSGPAGLSAAFAAGEAGAKTLLLERLERPGRKLLASGGGRCNLGNTLPPSEFMKRFGRDGRFMSDALNFAPASWLREFLSSHGSPVEVADGFHYFSKSGKAQDILDVFLSELRRHGVRVETGAKLESLSVEPNRFICEVQRLGRIECSALVLAAGGLAWPGLGGCSDGLEIARKLGHSIVKPYPAMCGILVKDAWVKELSGLSLPSVRLSIAAGKGRRVESEGELLFTHDGLSGPAALDISGDLAELYEKGGGRLEIGMQMHPGWGLAEWASKLDSWRTAEGRKLVRSALAGHMPHSLADAYCRNAGCSDAKCCELKAAERDKLAASLACAKLECAGIPSFDKAMLMKGGVSLKEIDPKTMGSRFAPGVFFAGEIADLAGPCGGYNMQWAFSSGRLAGASAASFASSRRESLS